MGYFSEKQAIEIWKEKWRGHKKHDIAARRGENIFRVYEVFEEKKNPGSRLAAFSELKNEDPVFASQIDPSPHVPNRRVISSPVRDDRQGTLF